jgi:hypothetical protein
MPKRIARGVPNWVRICKSLQDKEFRRFCDPELQPPPA